MIDCNRICRGVLAGLGAAGLLVSLVTGAALAEDKAPAAKPVTVAANAPAAAVKPAEVAVATPVAPKVERETFGEWELECFTPKVNGLNCQIVQKLVAKDSNQLVLIVSVAYAPESKKHLMQMALPLNFMLKPGVELAIGDAKTVVQVDRCSNQGCFVEGIAGDDLVAAMTKGDKADVKFLANAQKRLVIPFSLSGFLPAYDKMKQKNSAS